MPISPTNPFNGVLLQTDWKLCSEHVGPDITRREAEPEGNTVLAFLEFMDEFNSGNHDFCIVEGFETKHRCDLARRYCSGIYSFGFHWIVASEVELVPHAHEPQGCVAWFKAVQRDSARFSVAFERLAKEVASGRLIAASAQVRGDCTTVLVNSTIQEHPRNPALCDEGRQISIAESKP